MISRPVIFAKRFFTILILFIFFSLPVWAQGQLTFEDVMKFEDIKTPKISANGQWVVYSVWPEVGDGEVRIKEVDGGRTYTIERGENPQVTENGEWVGAIIKPPTIAAENDEKDTLKTGLTLLKTSDGETVHFDEVEQFSFSNDGKWVLIYHHQPKDIAEKDSKNPYLGEPLTVYNLQEGGQRFIPFVQEASIDSTSQYLAYSTVDTTGSGNAISVIHFDDGLEIHRDILSAENGLFSNLTWDSKRSRIAFTSATLDTTKDFFASDASVLSWNAGDEEVAVLINPEDIEKPYRLRSNNKLTWTHDGTRLFYGVQLADMVALDEKESEKDSVTSENLYDFTRILDGVESDVWHWDDPRIKPNEKEEFEDVKEHLYTMVYHFDEGRSVQLATADLPDVEPGHHREKLLGSSSIPYLKLITWDGWYEDVYLVDQETGEQEKILEKQQFDTELSPGGKYVAWFDGKYWLLRSVESGEIKNLTEKIETPFADEDNDRPQPSDSYNIAGWTDGDEAVLIYDKYDIWQFDTETGESTKITDGRDEHRIFRIYDLDDEKETFEPRERLLLTMYHDLNKNYGFYTARIGREGGERVLEEEKRFNIVEHAENDDAILYTRESFTEYPNLWVASDMRFRNPVQVSNLHEDLTEKYAWGHAELVDWINLDGEKVQGVLYYPGNYDPEKRYPVFIYYYERFSQRLHEFNTPYTNHRPNIAQYTSDGYAFFLPDVWFDVPLPGYSATKNIVPGVQKLVEMGVADPDAIGLHGHSWSGYMTAHVVTQTDIFAAAVAGAPVANMTSAYGGIRWGSGLARQFQYEQTQSRLGVSLWEDRSPYIENSPLFFADRINTPLLIQHGDADEAVPWYQSIELYLAMRRLGKEAVFLQYHDEPHHLRKLPNRLDYAIKMKEFMDHYLKGKPAPKWITDGVQYLGK